MLQNKSTKEQHIIQALHLENFHNNNVSYLLNKVVIHPRCFVVEVSQFYLEHDLRITVLVYQH